MWSTQLLILCLAAGTLADFGRPVFIPTGSRNSQVDQSAFSKLNQAQGGGAAAGNAGAGGLGTANTINKVDHQSDGKRTQTDALSANSAAGDNPTASGAAQANGQVQGLSSGQRVTGFDNENVGVVVVPVVNGGRHNHGGFNNGGFNNGGFNNGGFNNGGFNNGGFNNGGLNNGGFNGGVNPGFNNGMNFGSDSGRQGQTFQRKNQSGGQAAGAGSASAQGPGGSATNINEAHQFAGPNGDQESALSAGGATGFNPLANGAAQTQGETVNAMQGSRFNNRHSNFGQGKR